MVLAWNQGTAGNDRPPSPWIVATSAFSAGVHYPLVRRVLHLDAPDGLLNYGQETGRAGRDGLHTICMVLLGDKWKVVWKEQYHNNFLVKEHSEMKAFLRFQGCRRRILTAYLDGGEGTACSQGSEQQTVKVACDIALHRLSPLLSVNLRYGSALQGHLLAITEGLLLRLKALALQ